MSEVASKFGVTERTARNRLSLADKLAPFPAIAKAVDENAAHHDRGLTQKQAKALGDKHPEQAKLVEDRQLDARDIRRTIFKDMPSKGLSPAEKWWYQTPKILAGLQRFDDPAEVALAVHDADVEERQQVALQDAPDAPNTVAGLVQVLREEVGVRGAESRSEGLRVASEG